MSFSAASIALVTLQFLTRFTGELHRRVGASSPSLARFIAHIGPMCWAAARK
jgi:hypothetical protein